MIARHWGWEEGGEMDEGSQKEQNSSCQTNKSWGYNVHNKKINSVSVLMMIILVW